MLRNSLTLRLGPQKITECSPNAFWMIQVAAMEGQLGLWEAAVAERDTELQNLQVPSLHPLLHTSLCWTDCLVVKPRVLGQTALPGDGMFVNAVELKLHLCRERLVS